MKIPAGKMLFAHPDRRLMQGPSLWLTAALVIATILTGTAYRFYDRQDQALGNAQASWAGLSESVAKIEEEQQIIRSYRPRYLELEAEMVVSEEDRLELVEAVATIRDRHRLWAMQLDVEKQATMPLSEEGAYDDSGTTMAVQASRIRITIPLLHEEDLLKLITELRRIKRGIIVTEECVIKRSGGDRDGNLLEFGQNLDASCSLLWLTMNQRQPTWEEQPDE
jgi:hypothetical protein